MKKFLLSLFFIITLTSNSHASVKDAHDFSYNLLEKIINISSQKKAIEQVRKDIVEEVRENIDINYISKFVLGKHWRRTTPAERKEFAQTYEEYLILTYAPKFQGYNGETYKINKTEEIADKKYITNISLILANKTSLELEIFIIQNEQGEYKIVDISGEGISFAATQRSEFSSLISAKGVKQFLIQLQEKVQRMKNNDN